MVKTKVYFSLLLRATQVLIVSRIIFHKSTILHARFCLLVFYGFSPLLAFYISTTVGLKFSKLNLETMRAKTSNAALSEGFLK